MLPATIHPDTLWLAAKDIYALCLNEIGTMVSEGTLPIQLAHNISEDIYHGQRYNRNFSKEYAELVRISDGKSTLASPVKGKVI